MTRRDFMAAAALPALASIPTAITAASTRLPIRKAVLFEMLPKSLSIADRFKLARDTGFEATECPTTPDQRTADEIKKASESARLPIHSVMNIDRKSTRLNSSHLGISYAVFCLKKKKNNHISLRRVCLIPGFVLRLPRHSHL